MQRGDIVKLVGPNNNLGKPWPMGGPGVYTSSAVGRRWFPNGTHGLVMGKTYPGTPGAAMYIYDVMVEGEIVAIDNQYLWRVE
jgi:hypothetical protein